MMKSQKNPKSKVSGSKKAANIETVELNFFNGLELPFDQSLTGFAKSFSNPDFNGGNSPHPSTIKDGIDRLSSESKQLGNYNYFDSPNTLYHITSSLQQKRQENAPIPIPWEIEPILSALVCARANESGNKSLLGEQLAGPVFNQLVQELSKKSNEEITGDYRWLRILEHPAIQLSTVHLFDKEVNYRLQALSSLIQNRSLTLSAKYTKKICRTLDSLVIEILSSQSELPPQTPAHQVIEELCESLLNPRVQARVPNENIPFFKFSYTPGQESEQSARSLCCLLKKCQETYYNKNRNAVSENSNACLTAYNKYLTNCLREKQTMEGKTPPFDAEFISLRSYFQSHTKDELHRVLEENMYCFVRTQFDQLEKIALLPYHHDPRLESKADISLGIAILENQQQHIIAELHQPFRLLNMVAAIYTFTPFFEYYKHITQRTKKKDDCYKGRMEVLLIPKKAQGLISAMDHEFKKLSQRSIYPDYVAIPDNPVDFPAFWSVYSTIVKEVFLKLSVTEDIMNDTIYFNEPDLAIQLKTAYCKLLYQTELYACCAARVAVQDAENTLIFYNNMLNGYKGDADK